MMEMKRYELKGVGPRPDWWLVRPDEIERVCRSAVKGKCTQEAVTPAGFPVFRLVYGDYTGSGSATNWSSALGSRNPACFGRQEGEPQTIMMLGGIGGVAMLVAAISITNTMLMSIYERTREIGVMKVLGCKLVGEGSVNSANIPIRRVVEMALNSNATTVVLAHNHPSGVAVPSGDDVQTTRRLAMALDAVGIELLDHIIVAGPKAVSLAAKGYIGAPKWNQQSAAARPPIELSAAADKGDHLIP